MLGVHWVCREEAQVQQVVFVPWNLIPEAVSVWSVVVATWLLQSAAR